MPRAAGQKRKQPQQSSASPSKKQPKQDGQKAVSRDIDVPIDEGFSASAKQPSVYIDEDGIIFDASLNQTQIGKNANKFYRVQLVHAIAGKKDQYFTHTRWGRVGEFGKMATMGPHELEDAMKEYDKKFKDKTGLNWEDRAAEPKKGKYTFIEKSYEDDGDDDEADVKKEEDDEPGSSKRDDVESKLPRETQRLVELIFNENHFNSVLESIGYDRKKMPLGKLGKNTINKGFEHLKELASLIKHPNLAQNKYQISQQDAIEDFTNQYYSTIPHEFGRNRPPLINDNDILQREVAMLDTLTDMEVADNIMKTTEDKAKDEESVAQIDRRFRELNLEEVTLLEKKSDEYQNVKEYLLNTAGHTHNIRYHLQDIFRISRPGEEDRFKKSGYASRHDSNRRLLWHGSRTTNYGGILSQGLRIAPPEAPVNGYMFGKGVYLADISTKSANYCMSYSSGGHGLLLLVEAELGRPMYELTTADCNAADGAKNNGAVATLGVGGTVPQDWVDAGCIHESLKGVMMPDASKGQGPQRHHKQAGLMYNEYVAYDVAQLKLKYLIRFAD